jgi:hypothetical protein
VGINSFKSTGEGLNFAVSAEDVKSFLARGQDRVLRTQVSAEKCEPKVIAEEPMTDKKGMIYLLDADCDGKGDATLEEPSSKREPITLFFDDDGDGEFDTLYIDKNHDGQWDDAMFDTDGNGKPDMTGKFRKGESEPYRWEKMEER